VSAAHTIITHHHGSSAVASVTKLGHTWAYVVYHVMFLMHLRLWGTGMLQVAT